MIIADERTHQTDKRVRPMGRPVDFAPKQTTSGPNAKMVSQRHRKPEVCQLEHEEEEEDEELLTLDAARTDGWFTRLQVGETHVLFNLCPRSDS